MAFLHASKSGYFPFCLQEATEGEYGSGTIRPFEMSLEDAMALYWKYKSFKVTGSISGSFTGDPGFGQGPDTYTFTLTGTGNPMDNGQAKMSDVVCNDISSSTIYFLQANTQSSSDPAIISNLYQGESGLYIYVGGSIKKTPIVSGLELKIYPHAAFQSYGGVAGSYSFTIFYYFSTKLNPDQDILTQGVISDALQIKINGTTYKAPMYVYYPSFTSGSASGSLLIEGVEERLVE
jgi:hypothetical protein